MRHVLAFYLAGLLLCPPARAAPCAAPDEVPLPALMVAAVRENALEPGRVRSMLRRSRVSALLPQVMVRAGRVDYDSVRNADALDPTSLSSDSFRYEVVARFSLDRLIFDAHELRTAEAAGRIAEHRAVLMERVTALWSERRKLDPSTEGAASDRCVELSALLDALTGGALLRRRNSLRDGPPRP